MAANPDPIKTIICKHWFKKGKCFLGDMCSFEHSKPRMVRLARSSFSECNKYIKNVGEDILICMVNMQNFDVLFPDQHGGSIVQLILALAMFKVIHSGIGYSDVSVLNLLYKNGTVAALNNLIPTYMSRTNDKNCLLAICALVFGGEYVKRISNRAKMSVLSKCEVVFTPLMIDFLLLSSSKKTEYAKSLVRHMRKGVSLDSLYEEIINTNKKILRDLDTDTDFNVIEVAKFEHIFEIGDENLKQRIADTVCRNKGVIAYILKYMYYNTPLYMDCGYWRHNEGIKFIFDNIHPSVLSDHSFIHDMVKKYTMLVDLIDLNRYHEDVLILNTAFKHRFNLYFNFKEHNVTPRLAAIACSVNHRSVLYPHRLMAYHRMLSLVFRDRMSGCDLVYEIVTKMVVDVYNNTTPPSKLKRRK